MHDILGVVFRTTILLFPLVSSLLAQTEATHRFDYPDEHFSIDLPAAAKEVDGKIASFMLSATSQLIPNAPKAQKVHAYTSTDLSTQAVMVVLTDNHLTDASFRNPEKLKEAANKQTKAMIDGSVVQSLGAENMSYDEEHHVLWFTATMTSVVSGRIHLVAGAYLTRAGIIQAQCYAKEAEFNRYEEECKRIIHSVVIDPKIVLLPPPTLSQLLGVTTQEADATYRDLTARVKAGDFSVDFRTLRMACAKSSICAPGATPDLSDLLKAQSERRWTDVVNIDQGFLGEEYINMQAHADLVHAYKELNKPDDAQFHTRVFTGLLQSILNVGDGRTTATAYEVMSFREIRIVLTGKGLSQYGNKSEPFTEGGHRYEKWTAENMQTHANEVVLFNVDAMRR